jgi:hypothetical protein
MLEMAKSEKRCITIPLSLEIIASDPSRIFVSRATSECLNYEITTGSPVCGKMINHEATKFIRNLLSSMNAGCSSSEYIHVIEDQYDNLLRLKHDYLDHDFNKLSSLELVDVMKHGMSVEFSKRVRRGTLSWDEKINFVSEKAKNLLIDILESNGFSRGKGMALLRKKPMLIRYFYVKLWTCLDWECVGRLQGMSASKVSNDLLDHEYILAATFFDGIASNDNNVNYKYKAVSSILGNSFNKTFIS